MNVTELAKIYLGAPVVFAPMKDETLRCYVDFRKLNAVTICDSHQLPRMDELADPLKDAEVFSALDPISGYWKV